MLHKSDRILSQCIFIRKQEPIIDSERKTECRELLFKWLYLLRENNEMQQVVK